MSTALNSAVVSRAHRRGRTTSIEATAAPDPFHASRPFTWWYARLRYADGEGAPRLTRLKERVSSAWHERGQPLTSAEGRPVFPDLRANRGSRAEVRAMCRDHLDCIFAFPFGALPFDEELITNPTFCRPLLNGEQRLKDASDAATYTVSLEDHICPTLARENRLLREQLAAVHAALKE